MDHEAVEILATLVSDDDARLDFLSTYFDKDFLVGERLVFDFMRRFSSEYTGGYWDFFETDNGGFFLSPRAESGKNYNFSISSNYFNERLSAQTAGIIVTLFTLNTLINALYEESKDKEIDQEQAEKRLSKLTGHYYALRDYSFSRPDAHLIYQAID